MSEVTAWGQVWKINGQFLRATACAGIAWVSWQGAAAGLELLKYATWLFGAGAAFHGISAAFKTGKAIAGTLRWKRFKSKGADPKADKLASDQALRKAGLMK